MVEPAIAARAEQLLPGGETLVRHAEGSALVSGAIPGESIQFRPTGRHRGMPRGITTAIDSPSPHRIPPACPVADQCGGCALQHLHPGQHITTKMAWITEHYRAAIQNETTIGPLPGAPEPGAWQRRRRIRWHLHTNTHGHITLGFHTRRSHRIVDASHCRVASPAIATLHPRITQALHDSTIQPFSAVTVTRLHDGIHILLEGTDQPIAGDPPFAQHEALPVQWWLQCKQKLQPWGRPVHTFHDALPATDGTTLHLETGAGDFIQADAAANFAMIHWIIDQTPERGRVVDLFCGTGNCSLPLAKRAGDIIGADSNANAVARANRNAKRLGAPARYYAVDLFHPFDPAPFIGADLLLLDPPRKGARRIVAMMQRLLPQRVIMIHCDPASGGRDAASMQAQGYQLRALFGLDMFAWSGHVETLSLWDMA